MAADNTLQGLPNELAIAVFAHVEQPEDLAACRFVCRSLRPLATDDEPWRRMGTRMGLALQAECRNPDGSEAACVMEAVVAWCRMQRFVFGASTKRTTLADHFDALYTRSREVWASLEAWGAASCPDIVRTLAPPTDAARWNASRAARPGSAGFQERGLLALRLLHAVHGGQELVRDIEQAQHNVDDENMEVEELAKMLARLRPAGFHAGAVAVDAAQWSRREVFLGLVGGYSAYNELVSVRLLPAVLITAWTNFFRRRGLIDGNNYEMVVVAASHDLSKFFLLDLNDGTLWGGPSRAEAVAEGGPASRRVGQLTMLRAVPDWTAAGEDMLVWMEELARRLQGGVYVAEELLPGEHTTVGISLFPRSGERLSVVVTRGIQVAASAVFAPEKGMFVYSIRVRLLRPNEEGGASAEERGFGTAQLKSRHWVLRKSGGAAPDQVDGDGVIGKYPLLREGGFRDDEQDRSGNVRAARDWTEGTFMYQSQSGGGPTVSFEGSLRFVPGSLAEPGGAEFAVHVGRFPLLTPGDDFIY